ncbi:hypothetical protein MNQ96_12740 [Sphingopyxis granuli]|uniref:hypothetical protein n=1 Tax=Sphingopyxis granuli TaxID=267128 RepID=UPI001F535565|nr:hypothetical protein [Sphingopyxis granuli]UNK78433.1 hypothetical protein MNQ96_12740 [Sphingopyxis granuli]
MALMAVSQARRDGHLLPNFDLPRYYAKRINEYRDQRGLNDGLADRTRSDSAGPMADPPTSEPAAGYADFIGDTLIAELLIHKALSMTPQERSAAALEGITDRLAEIQEELWIIGRDIYRSLGLDEKALATLAENCPAIEGNMNGDTILARSRSGNGSAPDHVEQFDVGISPYFNIHDARAAFLRQQIRARGSEGQAMTTDREHIISKTMLDAESRYGNASEQFAVSEEGRAARLGDRAAARIWQIVAERLHTLHDIARPLGRMGRPN